MQASSGEVRWKGWICPVLPHRQMAKTCRHFAAPDEERGSDGRGVRASRGEINPRLLQEAE